jgi:N-acetyl sugar amidotransferase
MSTHPNEPAQPNQPRECTRCVMTEADPSVTIDEAGLCSYCRQYDEVLSRPEFDPRTQASHKEALVARIRSRGRGKRYDCVLGLSGGVDSSYAAYIAKRQLGLRPLAVHVDNGWNSELAVKNIENIVRKLDIDLVTEVIDWEEFQKLQLSFFRAGVVDLEMPSDHAIVAAMHHTARRFGISFVVTGDNHATETTLPAGWNHRKTDLVNLRAINAAHERTSLKTFPQMGTLTMLAHQRLLRIEYVGILSYVPYVKTDAIKELEDQLGWRAYGGKHFESIITRFYQGYILPKKFGIDKRRIHFSRLICSGQLTKADAFRELAQPHYDPKLMAEDKEYVCKKLGLSLAEFEAIMAEPPRPHLAFASDQRRLDAALKLNRTVRTSLESARKRLQSIGARSAK